MRFLHTVKHFWIVSYRIAIFCVILYRIVSCPLWLYRAITKKVICHHGSVVGEINMQISSQQMLKMNNCMLLRPIVTKYRNTFWHFCQVTVIYRTHSFHFIKKNSRNLKRIHLQFSIRQVAQLSQRDRAAGWVSYRQKCKTIFCRQYRSILHCDVIGL